MVPLSGKGKKKIQRETGSLKGERVKLSNFSLSVLFVPVFVRVRCFACKCSLEQRSVIKLTLLSKSCLEHLPSKICSGEASGEDGSEEMAPALGLQAEIWRTQGQ